MTDLYMADAAYKPNLAAAKAAGVIAMSVYLTGAYSSTCAQPAELHAEGMGALGNYEEAANEIVVTDHAGGISIGQRAAVAEIGKGFPANTGKGIPFSVDVNVPESEFPHVGDVFEGIKTGIAGRFVVMAYGEGALIDYLVANHGLIRVEWLSASSSFPGWNPADPNVALEQEIGNTVPGADLDRITNLAGLEPLIWWPPGSPYANGATMTQPTDASIEKDVQTELNQGTAQGQTSWAGTERAILGTAQTLVNLIGDFRKDVDDKLAALQAQIAAIQSGGSPSSYTGTVTLTPSH